jgi:hypothetical protein
MHPIHPTQTSARVSCTTLHTRPVGQQGHRDQQLLSKSTNNAPKQVDNRRPHLCETAVNTEIELVTLLLGQNAGSVVVGRVPTHKNMRI